MITVDIEKETKRFDEMLLSTEREGVDKLIAYLHTTDFYSAPASTRFHMSCPGGLLKHSLNVAELLLSKFSDDKEPWGDMGVTKETIIIVALCHDLCKANFYKVEMRNRKNEKGAWEQYPFYVIDDQSPYGHGEKSAMIAANFIKLSAEERYAIRWHMGFSEPQSNYQYVGKAMEKYPLVLALNEADLEATYILESESNDG